MARQVIDTTTNNGTYIGDPAKTAFEKTNANFAEVYTNIELKANINSPAFTGVATFSGEAKVIGTSGALWVQGRNTTRDWAFYSIDGIFRLATGLRGAATTDVMTVTSAGVVTAASFNPTSTSDVKDFIEGYRGDALDELDRLVVISYRYRPEFIESDKTYVGFLQENVKSVKPDAANDSSVIFEVVDDVQEERNSPGNIDITQILALNTRAHQQNSERFRKMAERIEELERRIENSGM